MPKVDYIFRGGLSKVYVCRQGGRGGQKSRKSDDVFYERPLRCHNVNLGPRVIIDLVSFPPSLNWENGLNFVDL